MTQPEVRTEDGQGQENGKVREPQRRVVSNPGKVSGDGFRADPVEGISKEDPLNPMTDGDEDDDTNPGDEGLAANGAADETLDIEDFEEEEFQTIGTIRAELDETNEAMKDTNDSLKATASTLGTQADVITASASSMKQSAAILAAQAAKADVLQELEVGYPFKNKKGQWLIVQVDHTRPPEPTTVD